eukprot:SAG31_NODE_2770_length_5116_cov_3.834164_2_plen_89_part_00
MADAVAGKAAKGAIKVQSPRARMRCFFTTDRYLGTGVNSNLRMPIDRTANQMQGGWKGSKLGLKAANKGLDGVMKGTVGVRLAAISAL